MHSEWHARNHANHQQRTLMAEAQQNQLAAQACNRPQVIRIYGRAMYRVGVWLSVRGARLQQRYRQIAAESMPLEPRVLNDPF
ncbi:MAG: hypothetical protein CL610_13805 [Anaerolineaceae bacterium]|nr:hypothetical protein [Anaerolineaceae bacterium]